MDSATPFHSAQNDRVRDAWPTVPPSVTLCHHPSPCAPIRHPARSRRVHKRLWILRLRFAPRRMTVRGVDSATPFHSAQNDRVRDAVPTVPPSVTLCHHPSPCAPIRHPARSRRVHKRLWILRLHFTPRRMTVRGVDSATSPRSAQNDRVRDAVPTVPPSVTLCHHPSPCAKSQGP